MVSFKRLKIKWYFFVFFIPVFLWTILLFILPQVTLIRLSFLGTGYEGKTGFTLSNYIAFIIERVYWLTFVRTTLFSILVTIITLIIALPVAFYISKVARPKYQGVLLLLITVPFWVSGIVRIYGIITLLREYGVLNRILVGSGILKNPIEMLFNDRAMIFCLVYVNILYMTVPIMAAYDLGAKKLTIWWKIIIPYCMPGIMGGSIIVFMFVMGSYITPTLVGGKYSLWFTQQIYNMFIHFFNWNQGAAFGFLLLLISSFIVFIALVLTKQKLSEVME